MKRCARHQHGVALAEVMVAMALGMLVVLLACGMLVLANGAYRMHSEHVWLNDGGHYAMDIIGQAVRQGAFINWDGEMAPGAYDATASAAIGGLDASSLTRGGAGIEHPLAPVAHGSDVLMLRFGGSGGTANGDGSAINCAGFGVADNQGADARGWSIFYVANDAEGEPELRCKYRSASGWGADAIVRGVDSFQVLYGVDLDTPPDGVPDTYLNASAVNALDASLTLAGATPDEQRRDLNRKTYWKRVHTVKVALLLHGDVHTRPDGTPVVYDLFGTAYADAHAGDDPGVRVAEQTMEPAQQRRARRLFVALFQLRNRSI
ncbi:PilW family protein [Rugamonas apoptosis]|uniref:PilW family protein n=1 Tax=Rugamonas apoptosis TaxID=2758570 RepID=A0A7W2FER4_9BURK|nr:PilW family protein [Rugamonas apoptosis]MBA5690323.1 PilW family protein [Rugamonas apoptosis]